MGIIVSNDGNPVSPNADPSDFASAEQGAKADTALQDATAFATSAQGALADTAAQPGDLATVGTSGDYTDLTNKPIIPVGGVTIEPLAETTAAFVARVPDVTLSALWTMQDTATTAADELAVYNLTASGAVTFEEEGDNGRSAIRLTTGGKLEASDTTFLDADLSAAFSVWGRFQFYAVPSNSRLIFGKRNTVGWSLRALQTTGYLELTLDPGGAGTILLTIEEDFFTDAPWFEVMVTYNRTEQMAYLMAIRASDKRAFITSKRIDSTGTCTSTAPFVVGVIPVVNNTENLAVEYLEASAAVQPRDFYRLSVHADLPNEGPDVFTETTWDRHLALDLCTNSKGFTVEGSGNFPLGNVSMDTNSQQVNANSRALFYYCGTDPAVILEGSSAWDGGEFWAIGAAVDVAECIRFDGGGELRNVETNYFGTHLYFEDGQNVYVNNWYGIEGVLGVGQNSANPQNSVRIRNFGINNMTQGIVLSRATVWTIADGNIEHMEDVGILLECYANLSIRDCVFDAIRLETCHEVSGGSGRGDMEVIGQDNGGGGTFLINQNVFRDCEVSNSNGDDELLVETQALNKIHVVRGNLETNKGWISFEDTSLSSGSPLALSAATRTQLTNNGGTITQTYAPTGGASWLAGDAFVTPKVGDVFAWVVSFTVDPTLASQDLLLELDDGSVILKKTIPLGAATTATYITENLIFPATGNDVDVYLTCTGAADVYDVTWTFNRLWKK